MNTDKYFAIIKESDLNPFQKLSLNLSISVASFFLKLKSEGHEPDEQWLIRELKKAGLSV